MEKLPQEILHKIVECQSRDGLHKIRLVNKPLSSAAAPFLFHTIPLWINLESLDALSHISEHPLLAGYVRKIVFSPLRFIEHRDESALQASVCNALEYCPLSLNAHAISLGKYMASYKRYVGVQKYLASESLDVKILSRAFAKLPRIEILDVDSWSSIASKRLFEDFGAHKGMAICTSDCKDTLPILFRALASSGTGIKSFKLGRSEDFPNDSHPNHSPVNDSNKTNIGALIRIFRQPDELGCEKVLSNLRNLEIANFDSPIKVSLANRDKVSRAIREIIGYSLEIESIIIGGLEIDEFTATPKPFFNDFFFPAYSCFHLNNLKLGLCQSTLNDIISFFRYRAMNIRHVELCEVIITDTDWSTVLARLRDMNFPKLEDFILIYCIDLIEDLCARDYIVRRTDVDPIQEELEVQKAKIKIRSP